MRRFNYYIPIFLQKVGYSVFFVLYKIFIHIEIRGRENLENLQKPVIFVPNHTSELDVTAIPLILPFFSKFFPIYFVTNPDHEYRSFGWRGFVYGSRFFALFGGYSIYKGLKNYAKSLKNHEQLLRNGQSLCIFPEGQRTLDGQMSPAHGGLGYLVHATRATVVPVAIDTFFNMSLVDLLLARRKVVISILEPITASELFANTPADPAPEDFRDAGQKILDRVKAVLE